MIALVDAIVAVQAVWLLPVLDARVEIVLAGGSVLGSPLHALYIGLDVVKLLALLALGAGLLWRGRNHARQAPLDVRDAHTPC